MLSVADDNCTICKSNTGNVSGIIKGEYIEHVCRVCFDKLLSDQEVSSGWADYMRNRDFEDHQADAAQPWTKDGTPSRDSRARYPEQASKIFTDEQTRNGL